MCLMAAFCTASAEQILPRDSVQRNCFKLALYTTRDHDCISNRIGSGIRTCPRCGCRLVTFGALPTPSTISRDHHAEQSASGPSSSSGKTLSSFHLLLARPCRSAPPRERFRSRATFGLLHCGKSAYSITSSACAGNAAHRLSRRGACAHHPVERADRGARYEAHLNEIARNKLDEAATARTCTATKCGKAAPPLQRSVRSGFKAR